MRRGLGGRVTGSGYFKPTGLMPVDEQASEVNMADVGMQAQSTLLQNEAAIRVTLPSMIQSTLLTATTAAAKDQQVNTITGQLSDRLPGTLLTPGKGGATRPASSSSEVAETIDSATDDAANTTGGGIFPGDIRIGNTGASGIPWRKVAVGGAIVLGVLAAFKLLR